MRGFLKFLVLVVLLVPAWIFVLSATGEERLKHQATVGPLVTVDQALQGAEDVSWVSATVLMEPASRDHAWRIEGRTAVSEGGDAAAQRFVASLHTKCQPLSDAGCWVLDRLDFAPGNDRPGDEAESAPSPQGLAEAQRLQIAQEQLREMGFDPGPSDGALGPKTQQAIKDYVAQTSGRKANVNGSDAEWTDESMAQAIAELSVIGILARGQQHHAQGDYHAALQAYGKVLERDPKNAQAWFNRGLIYQDLGIRDLAIAAYDRSLELRDDHAMAYHSRGNVYFEKGNHWRAFSDHADGLGVRYIGDGYLVFTERMGEAWTRVEPQVAAMVQWAEVTWSKGKATLEEKLEDSGETAEEEHT
jgi:tetratricopeptide (TPR) repeat protein